MITIEIKTPKQFKQDQYSGFITFDYDFNVVQIMRSLPFRYYHSDTKEWEVPKKEIKETIKVLKLNHYKPIINGEEKLNEDNAEVELPESFEFKTQPFKHQLNAVIKGINCNRWFLGDEQGLGKTKTVIDIAVARKQLFNYQHCLIVCGVNTLKWNWRNEIITHSNEAPWILGQKSMRDGKIKIGSTKDKINDLKYLLDNKTTTYFLITNIESFRDKEFAETVKKLCDKGIINMVAADEMHKMKNPASQQTKGFLKINAECEIAMTGTPLMNSPLDLYVILKWLGVENHAFYSFKNHYCVMGGYGGYEIVGYKNMEQLTRQVNAIMLRRLKKDVLDLPDKMYIDEYVEMEGKQLSLYNEVKAGIKTALANGEIDLVNPLSSLIRLRQTTGYPGIISNIVTESAKLDRMQDLVEEAVANGNKVILFSNWTQMVDEIYNRLSSNNYGVSIITGDTKDNDRQNIVDLFQNKDYCKVLVGTIGAMGTGLTLTAGTVVIFVDEPWNKALYDQAVDRCHRIGQKNNITIYNLLTKDSIDEKIHKLIYKKGAMSDAIIDGKIVGNKTEIFNYLLS